METTVYPNWFAPYAQPLFEKHLMSLAGRPGLKFIQIGAFTGEASAWMVENVLTGLLSSLDDVDTWEGSDENEHDSFDWADVLNTYTARVARYGDRIVSCRMTSAEYWRRLAVPADFVYIDGDHSPYGVLRDAVSAYEWLNVGGLLAFDDYPWINPRTGEGPGVAVDAFAACYRGRLQLIQLGAQAWFRKIR